MRNLSACFLSIMLAGCATANIRSGATEQEVRAQLGAPSAIMPLADNSSIWEYPRGPLGLETYLAKFAVGRLVSFEQVLTDDNMNRIGVGEMTAAEVRRLLGPPHRVIEFANLGQTAWDYLYRDTWGYRVELSVMIDRRGIVAGKVSRRIDDERDHAGGR